MAVQVLVLCEMNKVSCVGYTEEFTRCLSEDTLVDNLGVWHPEMPKEFNSADLGMEGDLSFIPSSTI